MTVDQRVQQNTANANIKPVVGFGKSMPAQFDTDGVLEVGDIIQIPSPIGTVYHQDFGGVDAQGNPTYGEFIVCNVQHPVNPALGVTVAKPDRAINFFPLSLIRNIWPAQKLEDGTVETITENGPLNPLGSAVDLFKSFQGKGDASKTDTQLAMEALAGRAIKVTAKTQIDVQRWRKGVTVNELRKTGQLTYDL